MKEKLKDDDEIIAQEENVTINMKELKTTLPNLVDKNRTHLSIYDLIKKLMLLIEVRLEIIQHTLKPILNDSIEVLNKGKETIQETNKLLDEIKEQINVLKENE